MKRLTKSKLTQKKLSDLICYVVFMIWPIVHVCVFYFYVNFSSIAMAFQKYDNGKYVFAKFSNFISIFNDFQNTTRLQAMILNSVKVFLSSAIIGVTLQVLLGYYIYKGYSGSKFFKTILFLPQIISSVVLVLLFKSFIDKYIPELFQTLFGLKERPIGLLANPESTFNTIMYYGIFMGLGMQVLIYSSTMSNINPSLSEAMRLESESKLVELFHIVLPMIWPTFVTFFIMQIVGLFTNQMNLLSFFSLFAPREELYTFGFFLYKETVLGSLATYPKLSAFGLLSSAILIPVVFGVRSLMIKCGPSVD